MSVTFKAVNSELRCIFHGDIVASAIPAMRERLNVTLDSEQNWNLLILNIRNVEKIDSLGINLIVWLFRLAQSANRNFKISGCNSELMKLFTLFRLQKQFTIEELGTS